MRLNAVGLLSAIGVAAAGFFAIVGSILPWAQAPFGISKAGIEGDGALTLVAGLIVIAAAVMRLLRPAGGRWQVTFVVVSLLLSLSILFVAIVDIGDVNRVAGQSQGLVRVGSGLYLTGVAGGVGVVAALLGAFGSVEGGVPRTRETPSQSAPAANAPIVETPRTAGIEIPAPIRQRHLPQWRPPRLALIGLGFAGIIGAILGVVLLLTNSGGKDDQSAVADLIQRESQAINARDWATMYQFTDTEFRQRCSQDAMAAAIESASRQAGARTVSDISVVIRGDRAEASYTVQMNGKAIGATVPSNPDIYVKSDGKWFDHDESPQDCNI